MGGIEQSRLKYVHQNAAHHGIVVRAENWRWCSAGWFERGASSALRRLMEGVRTDRVNVADAFEPVSMVNEESRAASSRRTPHVQAPSYTGDS